MHLKKRGRCGVISQLPDSLNLGLAVPAAAIALEAGLLIHDFHERGVRTEYKGDVDLVTEADRAAEKLIVEKLNQTFPNHGIFGEEGTRARLDAEYRWYVDPLDGTPNFAHGFPYFCESLGAEHRPAVPATGQDGATSWGAIDSPVHKQLAGAGCGRRPGSSLARRP